MKSAHVWLTLLLQQTGEEDKKNWQGRYKTSCDRPALWPLDLGNIGDPSSAGAESREAEGSGWVGHEGAGGQSEDTYQVEERERSQQGMHGRRVLEYDLDYYKKSI